MVVNHFQPILAIRMVLESIVPPNGDFSDQELQEIQDEVAYWTTGTVEIAIARREVTSFPLPIKLYLHDRENHVWWNYGESLVDVGIATYGVVDLTRFDYLLWARGIDAEIKRLRG